MPFGFGKKDKIQPLTPDSTACTKCGQPIVMKQMNESGNEDPSADWRPCNAINDGNGNTINIPHMCGQPDMASSYLEMFGVRVNLNDPKPPTLRGMLGSMAKAAITNSFQGTEEPLKPAPPYTTDATNKDDLEDIRLVAHVFYPNEHVFFISKNSYSLAKHASYTRLLLVTDKRMIMAVRRSGDRVKSIYDFTYDEISSINMQKSFGASDIVLVVPNPRRLQGSDEMVEPSYGYRMEGQPFKIALEFPKESADNILTLIKGKIEESKKSPRPQTVRNDSQPPTISEQLEKLAKLKTDGLINDEEFSQLKQELIDKM